MDQWLANPAIQAAIAPFVAALVVAVAVRNTRLAGLAIALAFVVVIALTMGFQFEALTAMRKLVLIGLGAALMVLALELRHVSPTATVRSLLAMAVAAAAVWMLWRILQQQTTSGAVVQGLAAAAYVAALLESSLRAGKDGVHGAANSLMLGIAAGALALLGASALLAQVGIAVAAGAGAVLLVHMVGGQRTPAGWTLALPAPVIAGLVCLLAVFTGQLAWYCLLPTLAIPWALRLVAHGRRPAWVSAILASVAGLIPALLAVGLAWFRSGATP